jgi:pyruvate dehydrogenase E1 component alpha subunit
LVCKPPAAKLNVRVEGIEMAIAEKQLLKHYKTMLVIRLFEERVEELFGKGVIRGTAHLAIGQEAIAVGVASALKEHDYITSTHRGHGHFIARGADPNRVMAEIYGKKTGYSGGRGGSQFMADLSLGFIGANGITGGSIPVATGAALSAKLKESGKVAICLFGDGASNQGTFHESLNMAATWQLPVVYVCENNLYAMSTHVKDAMAIENIAGRAIAYGMPGKVVDGNDLFAVHDAVSDACVRARGGEGPMLLECKTYRLSGHSRGDQCNYRDVEEVQEWGKSDPIVRLQTALLERGLLTGERDAEIRESVAAVVDQAVAFAEESEYPDVSTLEEGVFA